MTDEQQEEGVVEGAAIRIFLNYRREDTGGHALHLYTDLAERLGEDSVFMDMRALEPGLPFDEAIDAALETCDIVLCLIGPRWLTSADEDGERRLEDPDDWVRVELEASLARRGVRVIPILVERTQMPRRQDLPDGLAQLARRQAFDLTNTHWEEDVEKLVAVIERIAGLKADQVTQERAERERQEREEAERIARERAEQEAIALAQVAEARLAEEQTAEQERLAREQAERERLAREQAEQERLAQERAGHEEAERVRLARQQEEQARLASERAEQERLAAAQAASTVPVHSQPPPPPFEPRPGLGGRKLALIGGAAALLLLLAIGAAVLLTRGGEETTPTTTTETTTTDTTTTTTTDEGPTFPTEVESRLLASIPQGIRPSCKRGAEDTGSIAAIFCTPTNPDVGVTYYLFRGVTPMGGWYQSELDFYGIERGSGDCFRGEFVGEESYSINDKPAGRVLCRLDDDGDAVRSWTDTRLNIGTRAFRLDANSQALFRAWRDSLGPNPP